MSRNVTALKVANVAGYVAMVVVNYLANALPINGYTTGQLSDLYPNLFTPAGFTFSIWGVIYLLLGLFVVYQLLGRKRANEFVERIGWLFLASSLLNAGWIFAWHYLLVPLSFLVMIALLASLIAIYLRLGIGRERVDRETALFFRAPFSVYLGWITVAKIANATVLLVDLGWRGGAIPEPFWAAAVIVAAIGITLAVIFTRGDLLYAVVPVWAFIGIIAERTSAPPANDTLVIWTAAAGIAVVTAAIAGVGIRKLRGA